ncbi:hypothetical protein [Chromobacterium haemolyticum]|uniref:hypothetical protein n=1 Tax=Chromobacterium haemolyticum TaxID=394935 RepID=UPI0012DD55C4|nr:hypothetical protein [Chromobacterium haemolyticum]
MPNRKRVDVYYSPLTQEEREWLDAAQVGMEWGSEEWDKKYNEGSTLLSADEAVKLDDSD